MGVTKRHCIWVKDKPLEDRGGNIAIPIYEYGDGRFCVDAPHAIFLTNVGQKGTAPVAA